MDKIIVETKDKTYPVIICQNFDDLSETFINGGLEGKKICIITDSNVKEIYLETVKKELRKVSSSVDFIEFEAGEDSKNLDTVKMIYEFLIGKKFDRSGVIVALGGGVTGDLAGFVAATYMRGVKFVQIPTTLLSQVDSSVGGKVGVDFDGNKNMVGAFYQPEFVYINIKTLKTLPYEQFSSGMGEVIKHGLIMDRLYFDFLNDNKEKIKNLDYKVLEELVGWSVKIKASVVAIDEKETGIRAILNFGHTFGHAVETLSMFSLLHGQCVALGMNGALYLSTTKYNVTEDERISALALMVYFDLPTMEPDFKVNDVYDKMLVDKKNSNNQINVVLLEEIGKAVVVKNLTKDEIVSGIKVMTGRP